MCVLHPSKPVKPLVNFSHSTHLLFSFLSFPSHSQLHPSFRKEKKSQKSPIMAPSNLPASFNATTQDIEMLLAAQCHLGSKNLQTHMEQYLWKTRQDGVNVVNIGKTWYVAGY